MPLSSVNPATGEVLKMYPPMTAMDVEQILKASGEAFLSWRKTSFEERGRLLRRAAELLRKGKEDFAKRMTTEMGKPIVQARGEVEKCAWVCEYYADEAENFLAREMITTDARRSYASFQPLGAVLAIMPWNFPMWQVFRFLAPTLMAGNVGILKHASNVFGTAIAIEDLMREAGFPEDVFRNLLIGSEDVAAVIENPVIRAVTLTGSTPAGQAVAHKAGSVLKKVVLELGGSDPYIILEDADMEKTVAACATSRLINGGQSCIAAKRFIVVESRLKEFESGLVRAMQSRKMGDPTDESVDIGPMARHDLRNDLHQQVQNSVVQGAKLLLGGEIPDDKGAYYPATVLTNVTKGMPAHDDELFGPVASIIPVKDEAEAIRVANDSVFGLGAAVFTADIERGERIAETEIEAGCCFVNAFVKSDPRLPFGGIKESGYGRELGVFGIREFVNIKTVYVA